MDREQIGKCKWARKNIPGVRRELLKVGCTPRVLPDWCIKDFKFCPYCGKEIDEWIKENK